MANKHEACRCSHTRQVHGHVRGGSDVGHCGICDCRGFAAFRRRRWREFVFWSVVAVAGGVLTVTVVVALHG